MSNVSYLKLTVSIHKEQKRFVAYSSALDLSTSGKTEIEAKKRFEEVATIFFEELHKKGIAKEVLTDLGWQIQKKEWTPPILRSGSVRVPVVV